MEKLHHQHARLQSELAEPALYADANKNQIKEVLLHKAQVDKELADIEGEWPEAQEALETITRES